MLEKDSGRTMSPTKVVIPALLAASLPLFAAKAASEHIYPYVGKVDVGEDNLLLFNVVGNAVNDDNCSQPWFIVSQHPLSDDRTRAQLQIAIASLLSHKEVFVSAIGCTADGRLLLNRIQIEEPGQ
jgi:hypothetical protein